MRFFIVRRDPSITPGYWAGPAPSETEYRRRLEALTGRLPYSQVALLRLFNLDGGIPDHRAYAILEEAFRQGREAAIRANAHADLERWRMPVASDPGQSTEHAYERVCLTLSGSRCLAGVSPRFDDPGWCGAFDSQEQFHAVLGADGGHSYVHVIALKHAREWFKRHGGGVLEEGNYVMHPKRDYVLVRFETFHNDMLQEMSSELRLALARLGAKRLRIETTEGVTFTGKLVTPPMNSGSEGPSSSERVQEFNWASPIYDLEHALDGFVWIKDNAALMSIIRQRQETNLTSYREVCRLITHFGLSLKVMTLFDASFRWARQSTYNFEVEFFDRAASR